MVSSRQASFSIQILQILDAGLVWLSFWLASLLREPMREVFYGGGDMPEGGIWHLAALIFFIVPFTPIALEGFGFYQDSLYRKAWRSIWQIVRAGALVTLLVGVLVIFLKIPVESRWILGGAAPIAMVFLLLRERATKALVLQMVREEDAKEAVLLVGSEEGRREFLDGMTEGFHQRMKVVGQIEATGKPGLEEMEELMKQEAVGKVLFAGKGVAFEKLSIMVELCEVLGAEAWVLADFMQTNVARPTFDTLGGKGMLVLRSTPELSWALMMKGIMDWVGALILLILTSPFCLVGILGIRLFSPKGSALFFQDRAGRYGKSFKVWKLRTMHPDAEAQLEKIKENVGNQMSGPVFKLDDDPRVFKWGSFLRKTSIDELPQLVNVLKGEMSLVGPRPLPIYEVEKFDKAAHRRRLSVKPGITCTWQAGGRNSITDFEDWVALDLEYIDNWSLWLDIKILLQTVPAVLFRRGAK